MKKLKYVLIALAVILLCVGGYVLYEFKLKTYDVADAEVDEILEDTIEVELPDGTTIVLDKEGNIVGEKKADGSSTDTNNASEGNESSQSGANNENSEEDDETSSDNNNTIANGATNGSNPSSQTGNNSTDGTTSTEKATVASIKSKYAGTFTMLENQVSSRINSLISKAKSEYSTKKSNGESIQFGYFYNKYMGAANSMESNIDAAMNTVISLVEKDLEANGFDKSYAQSFRDEYEATKKSLRDDMLNKALSFK